MRRWLVLILLFALVFSPSRASAQGGLKLDSINIELWSEYDQSSMLVIYQFTVSQDTPLPVEMLLRFPQNSNLVAVAVEENEEWFNKDFTSPVETGNWQTIKVKVESYSPHRIEYYEPLNIDGNKRQFKYQWFGDYNVNNFTVTALIPADSTDFVTTPPSESTTSALSGKLIARTVTKSDLKMGNSFQFELEYQRESTGLVKPTTSTNQVQPSTPIDDNTAGRVSIANLPWIIGGFGLALIVIALISYWRSTQSQSNDSQPRRRRRQKIEETEDGQAYCHECGTRAQPGDRFCRTCGSRLRVE